MADFSSALPTALKVGGTLLSARGTYERGKTANEAAKFQAAQMEQLSGQQIAASQRHAADESRSARYLQSRALALAAASGAGTGGSAQDIIANIAKEGAYRSALALYEGNEAARQSRLRAAAARYSGAAAARAGRTGAFTTLLAGGSSLFNKYWAGKEATENEDMQDGEFIGYPFGGA